jgi:hypothetical protein
MLLCAATTVQAVQLLLPAARSGRAGPGGTPALSIASGSPPWFVNVAGGTSGFEVGDEGSRRQSCGIKNRLVSAMARREADG